MSGQLTIAWSKKKKLGALSCQESSLKHHNPVYFPSVIILDETGDLVDLYCCSFFSSGDQPPFQGSDFLLLLLPKHYHYMSNRESFVFQYIGSKILKKIKKRYHFIDYFRL